MSINRRGGENEGNYFYRFTYKGHDFCEGGFRTSAQATEAQRLMKNKAIAQNLHPEDYAGDMTMRQAGEWWLREYAPSKRSRFVDTGRMPLIMDYFDKMTLRSMKPQDIDTFLLKVSDLRADQDLSQGKRPKRMSDHTRNHYRALIHALYERLKKKRMYAGENPASYVDKIQVPTARCRFIYPMEEALLTPAIAEELDLYDYYVLGMNTGMRIGEMRVLRVENIDMLLKQIFVPDPKNRHSRYVPFDGVRDPQHEVLRLMARRIAGKGPHDYVLPHWGYTYLKNHFYHICKSVKIKNLHIHDWRHTFAYTLLSQGVPLYKVSMLLGHSSQDVTQKHYGHLAIGDLHETKSVIRPFLTCNRFATGDAILVEMKRESDL